MVEEPAAGHLRNRQSGEQFAAGFHRLGEADGKISDEMFVSESDSQVLGVDEPQYRLHFSG